MTLPMIVYVDQVVSPIGTVFVASDGQRLCAVDFGHVDDRLLPLLRRRFGAHLSVRNAHDPHGFTTAIEAYFSGELNAIANLPVTTDGTDFQQRIWAALREIPPGHVETYGGLAARLGMKTASRAVGLANGRNPINIVIPCHRVIGANGALTGYGGGIERKRWLLNHEGVQSFKRLSE